MLGDSAVGGGEDAPLSAPTPVATASPAVGAAGGGGIDGADVAAGGGSNSGDDYEKGERSLGGNRWPRQETLALLKIRSDMDVAFRDASVKGPLWDEVSRKLAELGYHRNAKKCKEKFENVYKYHKRTKDGRSGKSDGKTYRFFDQLEALENSPAAAASIHSPKPVQTAILSATPVSIVKTTASLPPPPPPLPPSVIPSTTVPPIMPQVSTNIATSISTSSTVPSTMPQGSILNISIPSSFPSQPNPTYFSPPPPQPQPPPPTATSNNPTDSIPPAPQFPNIPTELLSNSTSSSSSTSSDETIEGGRRKRKRKWKDFFERLMKEVIEKQEDLQRRFLDAIEKREQERNAREEAWRAQELQRINREREILAQERSIAAAKDQAVMSFLQKIAEQQNIPPQTTAMPQAPATAPVVQQPQQQSHQAVVVAPLVTPPPPQPQQQQQQLVVSTNMEIVKADNNNGPENMAGAGASSSRWPKAEVEALINLRTSLDAKYNENTPKGPLWEEISTLMKKIGYNRSSKRCKEKWENINKYFKKVKESNKKRPEDSKTCPYFHQLDALYRERSKNEAGGSGVAVSVAPLMVRPEQQWPPQQPPAVPEVAMEDTRPQQREDQQQHHEGKENEDDNEMEKDMGDEDYDDDDDDDEGGGNNYEVVASKPISSSAE